MKRKPGVDTTPTYAVTCLADGEGMSRTTPADTRPVCLDEFAELHREHGPVIEGPKPIIVNGDVIRCPHCGADLSMTEQTGGTIRVPSRAYFDLTIGANGQLEALDAEVDDQPSGPECSSCGGELDARGVDW